MNQEFKNYKNIDHGFKNCSDCEKECIILYDSHHDEYFSLTCGTVRMQNNQRYEELINTQLDDEEYGLDDSWLTKEYRKSIRLFPYNDDDLSRDFWKNIKK